MSPEKEDEGDEDFLMQMIAYRSQPNSCTPAVCSEADDKLALMELQADAATLAVLETPKLTLELQSCALAD